MIQRASRAETRDSSLTWETRPPSVTASLDSRDNEQEDGKMIFAPERGR